MPIETRYINDESLSSKDQYSADEKQYGGEKFRGTSEIPLTNEGVQSASKLAMQIARKGGIDRIMTSDLGRTVHTAKILSHYTHAPITYIGDALHPWHLGGMEGQPVNGENLDFINHLIKQEPDAPIPGRGERSQYDGESFNTFKNRTLKFLGQVVSQTQSNPDQRTALVTHYRVRRLLEAWMRKGMDPSGEVDRDEMALHATGAAPGTVDRLTVDPYHGPQISSVDMASPSQLKGGVYFIRHEKTAWNSQES